MLDSLEKLKEILKKKGLKYTKQREIIFLSIINHPKHLNAIEIYNLVNKKSQENIGIATVYRALAFLEESKLISSISLNKDSKKFETSFKEHHDHLICLKCEKIIEFNNNLVEEEQKKIAKENKFKLVSHTMNLYGICIKCENNEI